ncbi:MULTISPECIES: 23S rRNA pseudouridine(2605) synthase RluB [Zhongshania]|jgi:23S rRNA pseudouridine2605 synthase|uniref:Pseudouridine synthase n=1 Tax=Zhongshania antarctica TaxID=641702 RepID=A0A840R7N3_9GAMM|nr:MULTISPECIES: pseudouridine synthase [Zhongshania]MBB5188402.1 23S rRNA pseudouridine2605 synthase [Zhongshania antarctica]
MIPTDEKLQKVLARAGLGSRREMEKVISEGRVTVDGRVAGLGDRVAVGVKIQLDGKPLRIEGAAARPRILLYNKPEGEICSRKDPEGRRSVFDRLPRLQGERWISVGRLDFNTTGLLLFTTDGDLANKLMHPSTTIEREYLCRVMGSATPAMMQQLRDGVQLEDGLAKFADIADGGGEGFNHWYYVVIMEGRNREVRRLWESQGLQVNRLKRVRYGSVFIPSKVKVGQWTELSDPEIATVYQMADMPAPLSAPEGGRGRKSR